MQGEKMMKAMPTILLTVTLALMVIPSVTATPVAPEVWPTDSLGNLKGEFNVFDDVFVTGSGFPASTEITIYIVDPDQSSFIMSCPLTTESDGSIPITLLWPNPLYEITTPEGTIYRLRDYEYKIWVDLNRNGQQDDGDAFNAFTVIYPESHYSSSPKFTVPEPGTVVLMLVMFGALATVYLTRKHLHY